MFFINKESAVKPARSKSVSRVNTGEKLLNLAPFATALDVCGRGQGWSNAGVNYAPQVKRWIIIRE
jgi:hypothetical protein